MSQSSIKTTATRLATVAVLMFGFGYLLVPLYDVICELTGLNGKTGTISASSAGEIDVDDSRTINIEFDTNINGDLPWSFRAETRRLVIRPGELGEAIFSVTSLADRPITGQAIPSVAPSRGSLYFNKTECFCFSRQTLEAGEERLMTVRFVIDPALPESIRTLVLSYTFFQAPETAPQVSENDTIDINKLIAAGQGT